MSKKHLPMLAASGLLTLGIVVAHINLRPTIVYSAADHIVISEIQVAGSTANDEFVELYNPTNDPVSLDGWRLSKEPQDGSPKTSLVASISGTIPEHGYFLITHPTGYTASVSADQVYSSTSSATVVAPNNTILLYSDEDVTLVDKVGLGEATDNESSPAAEPTAGQSVERKANIDSTADTMTSGIDQNQGNGQDTNNNSVDFVLRNISEPQNSSAIKEPPAATPSPTPTLSPSPTPTPNETSTPTPTSSPSPTPTETPTPTPTTTPSPIPTETATPTATPIETVTPSPTPTVSPTPTESPTPSESPTQTPTITPSPTISPSSTPTETPMRFSNPLFSCQITLLKINVGFLHFTFPKLSCTPNR